ncbi:MAG: inositol monophosphatase family protein [Candidatus Kerfeldbacteria bacterium]|jgi:myo-inositol-1(or 4)-monophosphatase
MEKLYKQIIKEIFISGKRIKSMAGSIKDVGIKKKYLTEEDIKIERNLKSIINKNESSHLFCAEEENEKFVSGKDVWVVDPISGTKSFIKGDGHYAVVVSHVHKGVSVFGAVYDVVRDELYVAKKGSGAFLNDKIIKVNETKKDIPKIILRISYDWADDEKAKQITSELKYNYDINIIDGSMAITDCQIASGKYDGIITFAKDSFPEFASSLIVKEAGGIYQSINGSNEVEFSDRIFVAGNKNIQPHLFKIAQKYYK